MRSFRISAFSFSAFALLCLCAFNCAAQQKSAGASTRSAQATKSTTNADASAWRTFTSTDGGFSVTIPGGSARESNESEADGDLNFKVHTVAAAATYRVGFAELPYEADTPERIVKTFDGVANASATNAGARFVLNQVDALLGDNPVRFLTIEMPGGGARTAEYIISGSRIYQLTIDLPPLREGDTEAKRLQAATAAAFFSSFRLLPAPSSYVAE